MRNLPGLVHWLLAKLKTDLLSQQHFLGTAGDRKPHVDPQGLVHWPVLFYYPEAGQQDAIEDFCESDSLTEHLDAMFSPMASPLEWDEQHNFTRERLELYYLSHAATPLKQQELTEVSRTGGRVSNRGCCPSC